MIYIPNFITEVEERTILEELNKYAWQEKFGRRMQAYGFMYKKGEFNIPLHETIPIPECIKIIIEKIKKINNKDYNQLTINEYLPGQGIDAHWDHKTRFGDSIAGISIGSYCTMIFENLNTKDKKEYIIEPRSLYIMHSEMRYNWTHKIAKIKYDIINNVKVDRKIRTSLTFREIL